MTLSTRSALVLVLAAFATTSIACAPDAPSDEGNAPIEPAVESAAPGRSPPGAPAIDNGDDEGDAPALPAAPPAKESNEKNPKTGGGGGASGESAANAGAGGEQAAMSVAVPATPHPSFLVGVEYTKGYATTDNYADESSDRGLRFKGAPSYAYEEKNGKLWSVKGTWSMSGNDLILTPTSGAAKTIDYGVAVRANCRTFEGGGYPRMASLGRVADCPYKIGMTNAECARAGTYTKSDVQTYETDTSILTTRQTSSYLLDGDGFIRKDYASNRSRTSIYGSSSLSSKSAPVVGEWWLASNGAIMSNIGSVSLVGYTFTASKGVCVK